MISRVDDAFSSRKSISIRARLKLDFVSTSLSRSLSFYYCLIETFLYARINKLKKGIDRSELFNASSSDTVYHSPFCVARYRNSHGQKSRNVLKEYNLNVNKLQ